MNIEKNDILNREDIVLLMDEFYKKLLADEGIAYIFTDVAKINMIHHMPVLADFWEMILFQKGDYQKNVMLIHQQLNSKTSLTKEHFNTWLNYFMKSVDELFTGTNAELAKQRACSIATLMQIKMHKQ
ncbi:group III truncated hemoglobin [soil metagenome]